MFHVEHRHAVDSLWVELWMVRRGSLGTPARAGWQRRPRVEWAAQTNVRRSTYLASNSAGWVMRVWAAEIRSRMTLTVIGNWGTEKWGVWVSVGEAAQ